MNTYYRNLCIHVSVWACFLLPSVLRADFLEDVGDSIFEDPNDEVGLLNALVGASSWITAICSFLGMLFLFWAWLEFRKKEWGSVVYTLGAVGGLFLTPAIVRVLRSIAEL